MGTLHMPRLGSLGSMPGAWVISRMLWLQKSAIEIGTAAVAGAAKGALVDVGWVTVSGMKAYKGGAVFCQGKAMLRFHACQFAGNTAVSKVPNKKMAAACLCIHI